MRITHALNTVLWFINSALWTWYAHAPMTGVGFLAVAGASLYLLYNDN